MSLEHLHFGHLVDPRIRLTFILFIQLSSWWGKLVPCSGAQLWRFGASVDKGRTFFNPIFNPTEQLMAQGPSSVSLLVLGIEPTIFRLVDQHLNHRATTSPIPVLLGFGPQQTRAVWNPITVWSWILLDQFDYLITCVLTLHGMFLTSDPFLICVFSVYD